MLSSFLVARFQQPTVLLCYSPKIAKSSNLKSHFVVWPENHPADFSLQKNWLEGRHSAWCVVLSNAPQAWIHEDTEKGTLVFSPITQYKIKAISKYYCVLPISATKWKPRNDSKRETYSPWLTHNSEGLRRGMAFQGAGPNNSCEECQPGDSPGAF